MNAWMLGSMEPVALETASLVDEVRRSVVQVFAPRGQGSGVIWGRDGWIVTNHHVVDGPRAEVELADGRRLPAVVAARDIRNDLAALRVEARNLPVAPMRVEARNLPAAPFRDARGVRVGEILIAVGHPFGVRGTATLGIVSARPLVTERGRELLQADVDLAPGNSGGPLTDCEGRVVGIASMVMSPGVALAIPSHVVDRFMRLTAGSVHAPSNSRRV